MKKIMKQGAALLLAFCLTLGGFALIPQRASALAAYENFNDLSGDPWYANYLNQSFLEGFFYGTSVSTFEPDRALTRGEAVTVLGRVHERISGQTILSAVEDPYEDVKSTRYYGKYISWAKENDLLLSWMVGREQTRFAPNEEITQNQLIALLDRYITQAADGEIAVNVSEDSWLGEAIADRKEEKERAALETRDDELVEPAAASDEAAWEPVGPLDVIEESHFALENKVLRGESSAYFVRFYQALTRIRDWDTPTVQARYQTIALENGGVGTLLPMEPETEHAVTNKKIRRVWEVVKSYEEYQNLLEILSGSDRDWELFEGELEISEETFENYNLLVIDCYAPGSPEFDATLRSYKYESNPVAEASEEEGGEVRTVNVAYADVTFNALGYVNQPRAVARGCAFFFPVPKADEVSGVNMTFYIQAEDGQAIGVTASQD